MFFGIDPTIPEKEEGTVEKTTLSKIETKTKQNSGLIVELK